MNITLVSGVLGFQLVFNNGVILCWMRSTAYTNTFPISFKHIISVNGTAIEGSPGSGNLIATHVENISLSGFCRMVAWVGINNNGKSFFTGSVYIVVIGY